MNLNIKVLIPFWGVGNIHCCLHILPYCCSTECEYGMGSFWLYFLFPCIDFALCAAAIRSQIVFDMVCSFLLGAV